MSEPYDGATYYDAPCTNEDEKAPECDGNENELALKGRQRGSNFNAEEVMALATSWVKRSQRCSEQNETEFWEGALKIYNARTSRGRTAVSLKTKWSELQRAVQKYLQAKSQVEAKRPSGYSEEDVKRDKMTLYRTLTGMKRKKGELSLGPNFKYVDVALYLSTQDEFYSRYFGVSRCGKGYLPSKEKSKGRNSVLGEPAMQTMEDTFLSFVPESESDNKISSASFEKNVDESDANARPVGVKRRKLQAKKASEEAEIRKTINEGFQIYKETSEKCMKMVSSGLDEVIKVMLLQALPEGEQKCGVMQSMVSKRIDSLHSNAGEGKEGSNPGVLEEVAKEKE